MTDTSRVAAALFTLQSYLYELDPDERLDASVIDEAGFEVEDAFWRAVDSINEQVEEA